MDRSGSLWYQDLCSCGSSAAVCVQNLSGGVGRSVGELSLQTLSDTVLDYNTTQTCPEGTNSVQTSISFQCGKTMGSTPKMVAESNCRYEVEWVTEYACHRDYLESHSCKLTSEQHDISIDLTPLTLSCKWCFF
ncbi:hypothetical protein XENOCAPTIV_021844 [Xenoophorus captivus]|uniref:MRH domain-containing protein n=1 Tax=Xenoophorus captivus TaxID=1517983 RepID=A0ABV0S332_9TELE